MLDIGATGTGCGYRVESFLKARFFIWGLWMEWEPVNPLKLNVKLWFFVCICTCVLFWGGRFKVLIRLAEGSVTQER